MNYDNLATTTSYFTEQQVQQIKVWTKEEVRFIKWLLSLPSQEQKPAEMDISNFKKYSVPEEIALAPDHNQDDDDTYIKISSDDEDSLDLNYPPSPSYNIETMDEERKNWEDYEVDTTMEYLSGDEDGEENMDVTGETEELIPFNPDLENGENNLVESEESSVDERGP